MKITEAEFVRLREKYCGSAPPGFDFRTYHKKKNEYPYGFTHYSLVDKEIAPDIP